MKKLFFSVLFIPKVCFGLGADSEEFIGISSNGLTISIKYLSEPKDWTEGNWIYGSSTNSQFKFCWTAENNFLCASRQGGKPILVYKLGDKQSVMYKDAMVLYEKTGNCKDELIEYYICEKGCKTDIPRFIFEVGHDGGC